MTASDSEISASTCERQRRAVGEGLLRHGVAADDAVELLARLRLEDPSDHRHRLLGHVPHAADGQRGRVQRPDADPGGVKGESEPAAVVGGAVPRAQLERRICSGPRWTTSFAGVAARQPLTSGPAHRCVAELVANRVGRAADAVDGDDPIAAAAGRSRPASPVCTTATRLDREPLLPLDRNSAQMITNAITRLTNGPARITTIRFHTGWL